MMNSINTGTMKRDNHCFIPLLLLLLEALLLESTVALSLADPTAGAKTKRRAALKETSRSAISRRSMLGRTIGLVSGTVWFADPLVVFADSDSPKKLSFQTLDSGVRVADIVFGSGGSDVMAVRYRSKVNVHITGRLLGKQGWIFEDSKAAGEDPFRLDLGTGTVIEGLEEGLQGMQVGGRRRIVIPSAVGYTSRSLEPIPRDFGNRQRLYTTVMNTVRIEREQQALGADLAGVVVLDVELLRFRN